MGNRDKSLRPEQTVTKRLRIERENTLVLQAFPTEALTKLNMITLPDSNKDLKIVVNALTDKEGISKEELTAIHDAARTIRTYIYTSSSSSSSWAANYEGASSSSSFAAESPSSSQDW